MKIDVHTALPVAIAMALALAVGGPIIWLMMPRPSKRDAQPVLDKGQTSALITYGLKCRKQEDCEEPLVCMQDFRVGQWMCLASECESDLQCESDSMCALFTYADAPSIRLCVVKGLQKEGERCDRFPLHGTDGCQPGLLCNSGLCGRPCSPDSASACPEGFVCHPWNNIPACLPSCAKSGCPPGKQCIRMWDEVSICGTVHGRDCEKQPCAPGEVCRRAWGAGGAGWRREVVNMWCALPCSENEGQSCPEGFMCLGNGYCERFCDEDKPGTCGPGEYCARTFTPNGRTATCMVK